MQWAVPEISRALLLLSQDMAWLAVPLFTGLPAALPSSGFISEGKQHCSTKALMLLHFSRPILLRQRTLYTVTTNTNSWMRERERKKEQEQQGTEARKTMTCPRKPEKYEVE